MVVFKKEFQEKLTPERLNWIMLNSLVEFDKKPELIKAIMNRLDKVKYHPVAKRFSNPALTMWDWYDYAYNQFFKQHGKFPDVKCLSARFKDKNIIIKEDYRYDWSFYIYEEFLRWLDVQIIHLDKELLLSDPHNVDPEKAQEFVKLLTNYSFRNLEDNKQTKESLINLYEEFSKNYNGIKTHIPLIDNIIGVLGNKSIAVLGGPNASGKSTLARTIAYNASVHGGKFVDYISFEDPKEYIWMGMVAIESYYSKDNMIYKDMRQNKLDDGGKTLYKKNMTSLLAKLKESDGFLNPLGAEDFSMNTYGEFKAKLEKIAGDRGRPADLVIIENVDSLKRFRGVSSDANDNVNNHIIETDDFVKTYCDGYGTVFLFLTQLSQEGIAKIIKNEKNMNTDGEKKSDVKIDPTVFRQYRALGDRCTVGMVIYSDPPMRSLQRVNIYFSKSREGEVPSTPIKLHSNFAQGIIGGEAIIDLTERRGDIDKFREKVTNIKEDCSQEDVEAMVDEDFMDVD